MTALEICMIAIQLELFACSLGPFVFSLAICIPKPLEKASFKLEP